MATEAPTITTTSPTSILKKRSLSLTASLPVPTWLQQRKSSNDVGTTTTSAGYAITTSADNHHQMQANDNSSLDKKELKCQSSTIWTIDLPPKM